MEDKKPKLEFAVNQGEGEIKKKTTRKRYDIPKTVQCHICGDLAAEHLHYGGIACYSCRAFFRRTVNSSRPMLDCANDNNCNITKETRKRCQSCRFEKCKSVGMKPSWVLSENDRSKLALRKVESPSGDHNIETSIKQEAPLHMGMPMMNEGSFIKKRHPSSPVSSPVSPPAMFKSSLLSASHQSPPSPHPYSSSPSPISPPPYPPYPPYYNVPFITNLTQPNNQIQNTPMQNDREFPYRGHSNNIKNAARNESKNQQQPDVFNKMQVSFMGPSDGLSFTIEAHREAHSEKTETVQNHHNTSKNQFNMDEKFNWRQDGFPSNLSTNNNMRCDNGHPEISRVNQVEGEFGSTNSDSSLKMNHRQAENGFNESDYRGGQSVSNFSLQLENNISPDTMVFIPNQQNQRYAQRQTDQQGATHNDVSQPKKFKSHHQHTRTIFRCISPRSASSENGDNEEREISRPAEFAYTPEPCGQVRTRIWKLSEPHPISPTLDTKSTFGITLEESVFVAQLNAIEDRVRCQVPMDVDHGRAFLECALLANPVSQSTIMHAYQNCIKRIVRFANSLQDFVELPPDDMQKLLVRNTVSIINIRIARWLHPKTSLKTQMALFWTGVDLYNEASECFDMAQMENKRVNSWEVFVSPWCCDSAYEDRYNDLLQLIYNLVIDNTTVVLWSVMCLFDADASTEVHAKEVIKSHGNKFSLLLQRYLIEKIGKEDALVTFPKFTLALDQLKEMADILINRRLIC